MSNDTNDQIHGPFSLIKFEAQIEISSKLQQQQKTKNNQKALDATPSPQDVLNNMLSPRYWNNNEAKSFMQYVSHHKSERSDVVLLKEELDKALEYNQARVEGICPIRQQLFSQAFDQLIRQATIDSPERGLLLMRVRDQHRMTLAAYQTLYQSSVSYGTRKMIQAQDGMDDLRQQLSSAEKKKSQLSQKKIQLISKKQMLQKKIFERKALQKQDRQDQFFQIQQQQSALQKFLSALKEGSKTQ